MSDTDIKIQEQLKNNNSNAFSLLYAQHFPKIRHYIVNNNGSHSDAEDIFQDAMIVLVQKVRQEDFVLRAALGTFIFAVCRNLWLKKIRESSFELPLDNLIRNTPLTGEEVHTEKEWSYREILLDFMKKITDHCHRLISDFFFKRKAIEQIQKEYQYGSRHSAQNQKHKCIEQIKKVKEREGRLII